MPDGNGVVEKIMEQALQAAAVFSQYDQEQTDRITRAVYREGFRNRVRLARMACDETGLGVFEHKVIKNVVATQFIYHDIKNLKTAGIISDDERTGIAEIAQPLGPILAVIPVTNPTSTVLFKCLISMKTRNPVIIAPHPKALKSCIEAARICYQAALAEDAPDYCVQWVEEPSIEITNALMRHPHLALILATGGTGLVKAAYSSGTPALGVGPGNVPVCIERSADIPFAVQQIITSKTFDNGTICASEQAVVVEKSIAGAVRDEFIRQGGYFLSPEETKRVEAVAYDHKRNMMNAAIVGQSAAVVAEHAGISIPPNTVLLLAPQEKVGAEYPLSSEILAPILAFYAVDDFTACINLCIDLNYHGGIGHTASIFSNDEERIRQFAMVMNAGRIVVNMPSAQGAVGGIFNTLNSSFTLGCGSGGKNITTDNISARHLLNIQRIARRRPNERFFSFDAAKYLDESLTADDIEKEYYRNY